MKRTIAIALMIAGALMLGGCHGKKGIKDTSAAGSEVSQNANGADNGQSGSRALGGDANDSQAKGLNGLNTESGPFARKIIYFDFDKSDIKPEFADVVTTAARTLTNNPSVKLRLEGNTDERGTREYNIGLGERRAQTVRRALMLQGVSESQLSTVSFGSEHPAAEGDDESAWSKNRRVELVYGQ